MNRIQKDVQNVAVTLTSTFATFLSNIQNIERYKRFLEEPQAMMPSIITVIAPANASSKGVIIIAYSYYFLIFLKSFDFQEVAKKYHIVLEPSWNGLCEEAILAFAHLTSPVFVMALSNVQRKAYFGGARR